MADAPPGAMASALASASRVRFHPLEVVDEPGREPLLGCREARVFLEVDATTIQAVEVIERAPSLAEAEATLREMTGEDCDLLELASYLRERGFVREVDGVDVPQAKKPGFDLFKGIRPERVAWMREPALVVLVAAVGALATALAALDPRLRPGFADLQAVRSPGVALLIVFLAMLVNAWVHELAHLFMARSYGVDSSIRVSNRFHIVVLETDVTNAWALPKGPRVSIFLAGIGYNVLAGGAAILAIAYAQAAGHAAVVPWLKAFAFVNIFPLLFQAFFFLRTDLYYVLLAWTGERNLHKDAGEYVGFRLRRALRRLRRHERTTCEGCGAAGDADDPFCLGCGRVGTAGTHTFSPRSSPVLLVGYGALAWTVVPLLVVYTFVFMTRMLTRAGALGLETFTDAFEARDLPRALDAGAVLLIVALQAGFLLFATVPGVVRVAKPAHDVADRATRAALARARWIPFETERVVARWRSTRVRP